MNHVLDLFSVVSPRVKHPVCTALGPPWVVANLVQAINAPDTFSGLLACGITTWLVVQAFINMAVVTALAPVTGIPLPFISYGGSALTINLVAVGVLLCGLAVLGQFVYTAEKDTVTSAQAAGTAGKIRMTPPQLWQSMSCTDWAADSGVSMTGPAS